MVAPDALPSAFSIAFRRLRSGIFTGSTIWSNSTTIPRLWRVGMWLLMDTLLRKFPFRSIQSALPNPVFATRGEMSDIELFISLSSERLINPAMAEMSVIELSSSHSCLSLVNLARGDMSVMLLSTSRSSVRLTAYSSPVKLVIFSLMA